MNEVVRDVGWKTTAGVVHQEVIRQGQVRRVLPPLPHVRRPKELLRLELVVEQMSFAQGLHVCPSIRGDRYASRKSARVLRRRDTKCYSHIPNIFPFGGSLIVSQSFEQVPDCIWPST